MEADKDYTHARDHVGLWPDEKLSVVKNYTERNLLVYQSLLFAYHSYLLT